MVRFRVVHSTLGNQSSVSDPSLSKSDLETTCCLELTLGEVRVRLVEPCEREGRNVET
jgi:hypothetical protein